MSESDTYQAVLEEGRDEGMVIGARRLLLVVGTPRLGEPNAATRQRLEAETNFARLEEWLSHTGNAESWSDLPGL